MSPARALLAARAQSLVNRLQREAGGVGMGAAVLVAVLVVAAVAAPSAGSFALGRSAGLRLANPAPGDDVPLGLAFFLTVLPLVFGLLGGLFGDDPSLSFGRLGALPIPPRQLLLAELASSGAGLMPILAAGCILGLTAGLATARPGLALPALLLAAQGLLSVLLIQFLVGALRTTLLARLRTAVIVVSILGFGGLLAMAGEPAPMVRATARMLSAPLPYLPATWGCRGLADLAQGRLGPGLLRQLAPLAATALFFQAVLWLRSRRREQEGSTPRPSKAAALWSFRHPAQGVARLFVSQVLQSRSGRVQLLMPAFLTFTVAAMASALTDAEAAEWAEHPLFSSVLAVLRMPWVGVVPAFTVLMSSDLWLNQFGWDGPGVKTLFLLPIKTRDLLLGKLLGLLRLNLLQLGPALLPVLAFRRPTLAELIWGLGAGAAALVVAGGLGHVFSAGLPRRVDAGLSQDAGFGAMLAGGVSNGTVLVLLFLTFGASKPLGAWGPPLGMWLLAAAVSGLYWCALPFLGSRVVHLREVILGESA